MSSVKVVLPGPSVCPHGGPVISNDRVCAPLMLKMMPVSESPCVVVSPDVFDSSSVSVLPESENDALAEAGLFSPEPDPVNVTSAWAGPAARAVAETSEATTVRSFMGSRSRSALEEDK